MPANAAAVKQGTRRLQAEVGLMLSPAGQRAFLADVPGAVRVVFDDRGKALREIAAFEAKSP